MTKLQPFEKLLTVLISGEPVTKDEIETKLGNDIYMYRLSTYIWHVKTIANGVVKSIKDGRIVKAYQLVNVDAVKKYLAVRGINPSEFVPGASNKKVSVSKFTKFAADLGSSPLPATTPTPAPVAKVKVKPAKKAKVKPVVPKVDTTENLVDEVVEITD
jgi:hypothetical protein